MAYAYGTNAQDRRLTQIKNLGRSGSALSQFDYVYDAVGQITQLTETVGTATNSTGGGGGDCHDKCCHKGKCCHKDKCCKKKCCKGKGECGKERCHQHHDRDDDDDDDRFGMVAPFDGRLLNGLLGLGIASLWGGLFWQFARRPRTTSRLAQVTSAALISALALNGCIFSGGTTSTTSTNIYDFTYDKLGQLMGVNLNQTPTESFTFDPSGNLTGLTTGNTTTSFTYNSLNQQTSPAGKVFDAKGQTTTDGTRTYEWDDQGRITAIVQGTQRTELAYDGMSRRTKITELTNGTVTSKKLYWWLGGSIVCERDGLQTGFPITKQYFGQGEVRGTTKLYYTFDHLGSIRELVDSAGTVQAEYRYSTYGERTKTSGNLESDWGYAGLWHHQASGLDLATYRAYDAANKRWISRDPLGEGVDYNLYRYCNNNPVNFKDPLGLEFEWGRETTWDIYTVRNGDEIQRLRVINYLKKIDATKRGGELNCEARKKKRRIVIELQPFPDYNSTPPNGDTINLALNPNQDITVRGEDGKPKRIRGSQFRVLAHELGHALGGALDDGPGRMDNVRQNENPIMTDPALGGFRGPERLTYP